MKRHVGRPIVAVAKQVIAIVSSPGRSRAWCLIAQAICMDRRSSHFVDREAHCTRSVDQPIIIARQRHILPLLSEKLHRREMERIERSNRPGKRLQSTCQDERRKLDERDTSQQGSYFIAMRACQLARMNARPDLVFDQSAGNERLVPKSFGRRAIFGQNVGKCYGCIEINQRSLRSSASSRVRSRKDMTGLRGGTPEAGSAGGVIHPFRTASAKSASANTGLRVLSGGTSSATTRSRSVTRTVSPLSASRTYSLSLFLRTLSPTAFMAHNVAPGSYLCQGRRRKRFAYAPKRTGNQWRSASVSKR